MQILESFVDSSSIFYICEVRGLLKMHEGFLCKFNPFGSSFVSLEANGSRYLLGTKLVSYPLYSKGEAKN